MYPDRYVSHFDIHLAESIYYTIVFIHRLFTYPIIRMELIFLLCQGLILTLALLICVLFISFLVFANEQGL
jgi:hypothetical protein